MPALVDAGGCLRGRRQQNWQSCGAHVTGTCRKRGQPPVRRRLPKLTKGTLAEKGRNKTTHCVRGCMTASRVLACPADSPVVFGRVAQPYTPDPRPTPPKHRVGDQPSTKSAMTMSGPAATACTCAPGHLTGAVGDGRTSHAASSLPKRALRPRAHTDSNRGHTCVEQAPPPPPST